MRVALNATIKPNHGSTGSPVSSGCIGSATLVLHCARPVLSASRILSASAESPTMLDVSARRGALERLIPGVVVALFGLACGSESSSTPNALGGSSSSAQVQGGRDAGSGGTGQKASQGGTRAESGTGDTGAGGSVDGDDTSSSGEGTTTGGAPSSPGGSQSGGDRLDRGGASSTGGTSRRATAGRSSTNSGGAGTGGSLDGTGGRLVSASSTRGGTGVMGGRSSASGGRFTTGGGSSAIVGGAMAQAGSAPAAGAATTGGRSSSSGGADGGGTGTPSSGCGKDQPGQAPGTVDVGGTQRTFILDVPANYDANTPTPILFAFHGMGTSGELFRQKFYGNLLSAFGSSYLVVHADALGDPTQWDSTGTKDVQFFDEMLESLASTYCVDQKRIFLTGHSSGGYFTNALACQRGDVVRGIAPQSGAGPIGSRNCKGPVAAIIIHGSNDTSVLPAEGQKSRDYWGNAAKCDMPQGQTSALNSVCLDYAGCQEGYPLVYCPYEGDHNIWADAPKTMFAFFESL